jgi:hypothetical protein
LVARTPWSHLQCASTSSLSWPNARFPSNFRGNKLIFPLLSMMPLFTDQNFCHFQQDTVPAPLTRIISYNIAGPISALGYQSPTLAQLMSRYATSDKTLINSASNKRKAPSLVAPSTAKKKWTSKRVLIQVKIFSFLSTKPLFIPIIFILCNFRPELSNQ